MADVKLKQVRSSNGANALTTSGVSAIGSFSFIPPGSEPISPVGIALPSVFLPSSRIETVVYGAGPVVGFEAHIGYAPERHPSHLPRATNPIGQVPRFDAARRHPHR